LGSGFGGGGGDFGLLLFPFSLLSSLRVLLCRVRRVEEGKGEPGERDLCRASLLLAA